MIDFRVVDLTTFEGEYNGHRIRISRNETTRDWEIFLDGKPTNIRFETAGQCKQYVVKIVHKLDERTN